MPDFRWAAQIRSFDNLGYAHYLSHLKAIIEYSLISRAPKSFPSSKNSASPSPPTACFPGDCSPAPRRAAPATSAIASRVLPMRTGRRIRNWSRGSRRSLRGRASHPQLSVAWALAKSSSIIPLIGARTRAQLSETLAALNVGLAPDEIAAIEAAVPADAVAGTQYDAHQMQVLDSER